MKKLVGVLISLFFVTGAFAGSYEDAIFNFWLREFKNGTIISGDDYDYQADYDYYDDFGEDYDTIDISLHMTQGIVDIQYTNSIDDQICIFIKYHSPKEAQSIFFRLLERTENLLTDTHAAATLLKLMEVSVTPKLEESTQSACETAKIYTNMTLSEIRAL